MILNKVSREYKLVRFFHLRSSGVYLNEYVSHSLVSIQRTPHGTLLITRTERISDSAVILGTQDTLICKWDALIQYNQNPDTFQIKALSFETENDVTGGFVIKLNSSLYIYAGNNFVDKMYNEVQKKISFEDYKLVCSMLNYMGFSKFQDFYRIDCDDCDISLHVWYDNGREHKIMDRGMSSNASLINLYAKLFALTREVHKD